MTTVLERLREALKPEFEVERELASGGMGLVYLARDLKLNRLVAIKTIRPELATAHAAERFLLEARTLARLQHPNVISVHLAGEADGLPYYVMDFFDGETLADRLGRGPLPLAEVRDLGEHLLSALEAVHTLDVIHRDIKPANIFLQDGRTILADFGIAKAPTPSSLTAEGVTVGTPDYMAPEQALGQEVTPRTDLYSVGLVLYEAVTGVRWHAERLGDEPDWGAVPTKLIPVVRKALAWKPAHRWADANTFRRKLEATGGGDGLRPLVLGALGVLGVIAIVILIRDRTAYSGAPRPEPVELAILPFTVENPVDTSTGRWLAKLTHSSIDTTVTLVPLSASLRVQLPTRPMQPSQAVDAMHTLVAKNLATGTVSLRGDTAAVDLAVIDTAGVIRSARVEGSLSDLPSLGYEIGLQLVRIVDQTRVPDYRVSPLIISPRSEAIVEYLRGDDAFHENRWQLAVDHFLRALAIDSTFALAAFYLSNAHRWLLSEPHPIVDLGPIHDGHRGSLTELDHLMIDAQLASSARDRFAIYRTAIVKYPRHGVVAFLYGDELLHRGPFLGYPLHVAAAQLDSASQKDTTFAPALDHLVWADLRLGRRADARRHLDQLTAVSAPRDEVEVFTPDLFEQVFAERFAPRDSVLAHRGRIISDPKGRAGIELTLRLALGIGVPNAQEELAELLLAHDGGLDAAARGSMYMGRAVALITLGRVKTALTYLDSAAALMQSDEARFQSAEWRVLGPALGAPGFSEDEQETGRQALRAAAEHPQHRVRARWALGVSAALAGDTSGAARWLSTLGEGARDSATDRLGSLLHAIIEGSSGNHPLAQSLSEPLLASDSGGHGGDPFARAVLHMKRADWLDSLGQPLAADSSRLWYEHFETLGFPAGPAQPAEIDWAVGTYARWLRGESARRRGDREAACGHHARVIELWHDADAAYHQLRDGAARFIADSCDR
jgi:serine/threonine protein kinase/tetratricopeptide (TPR) repeat protein